MKHRTVVSFGLNPRGTFSMQNRYIVFTLFALIICLFTDFSVASAQAAEDLDGTMRLSLVRQNKTEDTSTTVFHDVRDSERPGTARDNTSRGHLYRVNERRKFAGALTTIAGVSVTVGGVMLWYFYRDGSSPESSMVGFEDLGKAMGIVFMVAGGLTTAAGISLVAVAHALSIRYSSPRNTHGTDGKYRSHYSPKKADKRTSLNVSPVISREFSGLSMQLRF
jgi:hypothetical protein